MPSVEEDLKVLRAAFIWLLNHYDPKDGLPPMRHPKVIAIAERIIADMGGTDAVTKDYEEFRRRYFAAVRGLSV